VINSEGEKNPLSKESGGVLQVYQEEHWETKEGE